MGRLCQTPFHLDRRFTETRYKNEFFLSGARHSNRLYNFHRFVAVYTDLTLSWIRSQNGWKDFTCQTLQICNHCAFLQGG